MSDRGRAYFRLVSSGSNTTVKSTAGTLHRVIVQPTAATPGIRLDANANLGATPNLNTTGSDTIIQQGGLPAGQTTYDFSPGVSFPGLSVAATSNARVTVIYE